MRFFFKNILLNKIKNFNKNVLIIAYKLQKKLNNVLNTYFIDFFFTSVLIAAFEIALFRLKEKEGHRL